MALLLPPLFAMEINISAAFFMADLYDPLGDKISLHLSIQ